MIFLPRRLHGFDILLAEFRRILEISEVETDGKLFFLAQLVEQAEFREITTGAVHAGQAVLVGPFQAASQSAQFGHAVGLGDHFCDQLRCALLKRAGWLSGLCVAHDYAIRGVGRPLVDAGQSHGLRVCPIRVAVVAFEEHRPVGEKGIQVLLVRQGFLPKHGVFPAPAQDPVVGGVLGRVSPQALLNVRGILRTLQIDAAEAERAIQEVDVAIGESGQD